jgi:phosphoglycerate dehydrogenase-like enzyme
MSDPSDTIRVIVAMDFSDDMLDRFRDVSPRLDIHHHWPDVPDSAWSECEVLYTLRHFPRPEEAPLLRWIQLHYAGVDSAIEQRIVQAEDVTVTNASGIHAQQIANYCLMMMLAFNYKLPDMMRFQQDANWPENQYKMFAPVDMHRQTVGIAGYGSIGRELARVADALGMTVLATKRDATHPAESPTEYSPEGTGDPEGDIPERIYPGEALATMAKDCDYLVLTVPLTEKTRHMVNERVLNAMKSNAVLVNIARGEVVDEKALITALSQQKIRGAALDVFEEEPLPTTSPLWQMDNVIISPHVSGNSASYNEKVADLFEVNLQRYIENRPLLNQLDREEGY